MRCQACDVEFAARAGARTCSTRCRVRLHRGANLAPAELRAIPHWVLHDHRKVPRQTCGQPASSTNPSTWSEFQSARAVVGTDARAVGLGFVLTGGGIACIDLDGCITDGTLDPDVEQMLAGLPPTWIEVSPSGRGLHIWGYGTVGRGRVRDGIEVYDRGRYITVTGRRWRDAPMALGDIQPLIDSVCATP